VILRQFAAHSPIATKLYEIRPNISSTQNLSKGISLKISIAMATYNGAAFIEQQLQSFSSQTRLPDELVITDDGSTDDTLEIIKRFALNAPFCVRLFRNPQQLGCAQNFGKALSLCEGDWVFLSDQDDVWFPHKISSVLRYIGSAPFVHGIINDQEITGPHLEPSGVTKLQNIERFGLVDEVFMTGCCAAFSQPLIKLGLPVPNGIMHDIWFGRLATTLHLRMVEREVLQYFRRHDSNTSNWIFSTALPPSPWKEKFRYLFLTPFEGWTIKILADQTLIQRIKERREDVISLGVSTDELDRILEKLRTSILILEKRLSLCSVPRWRRWPTIVQLSLAGKYRSTNGLVSIVRDLIMPRSNGKKP
jgi:hypothetical protein